MGAGLVATSVALAGVAAAGGWVYLTPAIALAGMGHAVLQLAPTFL